MPPLRPCLGCGRLVRGSRCEGCRVRRASPRVRRPDYTYAEEKRRADTVRAWREEYGDLCPGWNVPAHEASDLTADHVLAVDAGGDEAGALTVLCRSCNGRKGARS